MPHRRRYPVDLVQWEHGCNQTHTSWHSFGTFQVTTDQAQKHNETALDTPKKEGAESSFPIKVHAIPGKTPEICKIFVVQPWCKKQKEKCKCLKSGTCILLGTRSRNPVIVVC